MRPTALLRTILVATFIAFWTWSFTAEAAAATSPPTIDAVVLLPANIIGTRTFAVQSADGKGMLVRAYGNDPLPPLSAGDKVRIAGQAKGESRGLPLLGTKGKNVTRLATGDVDYVPMTPEKVNATSTGTAVLLTGTVTHTAKHGFSLSDDLGAREQEVIFPKAVQLPKLELGSTVEVRGVVLSGAAGQQVVAVGRESFKITAPPKPVRVRAETDPYQSELRLPAPSQKNVFSGRKWILVCAILALSAVCVGIWSIWRRNRTDEDIWAENR